MSAEICDVPDADLRAELLRRLNGKPRSGWSLIHYKEWYVRDCAIVADGTVTPGVVGSRWHNDPASERLALEAMVCAERRCAERRSEAAKRAAVTRARRIERRVYRAAEMLHKKLAIPPSKHCCICGKALTDQESCTRGIGPECWQSVLQILQAMRKAA